MIIINDKIKNDGIINFDSGFYFGRGLFETVYIREKPILLKEHLDRLNRGLAKLNIDKIISEECFMDALSILGCKNCAVKLMVSENNTIFSNRDIPYKKEDYERGFSLVVSKVRRNPYSHMTYIKSFNYYDNIIEREWAKSKGYDEALFLNTDNFVSEGSVSNIFFIKDNVIYTPHTSCGLLEGVVRNFIINNMNRYKIVEGKYRLDDFLNSDGVFITNSLLGIMKVNSINDIKIKTCNCINEVKKLYDEFLFSAI
ncbi:aminodeoxychorismate lyase [Clostridium tepidiprofundi DSM 19306]|uniref:Aminodeoxychorismate lyase n=1 Tax=Clostridium tepidiprofundi DSM 19306 TaxID=1121338 RepID=A0A151B5V5_9CLOT|nr:aminotransferase class IV [Clostridium tepidiprofundi]KYH35037.1 aminodeoxychorismate lyase [Clostridium tepidiprofundi DSM 19306]